MKLKEFFLAAGFFLVAILLVFFPFFFQGKTIFSTDLYLQLYKPFAGKYGPFNPFNHFDSDILRFCYLYQWGAREYLYQPYWISEIFGGIPLYANPYASHFSTLNWILPLGPLHLTYPLKLFVTLWIAGMNMFGLTRYFKISFFSSLLSGMAFMFSGLFITMLLRWWIPGAFSWMPLVLLFSFISFYENKRWAYFLASLFLAFSFLDGFIQTSAMVLIALGCYLLVLGWQKSRARGLSQAVLFGSLVVLLAFCLSAVMWLPQLEYFKWDIAKGSTRIHSNSFGKTLWERLISIPLLVSAFFPLILGTVRTLDVSKLARTHLQDFALFIGTLPVLFGIFTWNIKKNIFKTAMWALVLLGLLIPIATPLDRFVYFRFLAVYILGMTALAGWGFDEILKQPRNPFLGNLLTWIGIFCSLVLASGLALRAYLWIFPDRLENLMRSYMAQHYADSIIGARFPDWMSYRAVGFIHSLAFDNWEYSFAFLIFGLSLFALWLWNKQKISKKVFIVSTFVLTFLQLSSFAKSWLPFNSLEKYPLFPDNEVALYLREADPQNHYRSMTNDYYGSKKYDLLLIPHNSSFFYGYSVLDGFEGVRPALAKDALIELFHYKQMGLLNVKYYVTNPEPLIKDPCLVLRFKTSVAIYENLCVEPRGRILYSYNDKDFFQKKSDAVAKIIKDTGNSISYSISLKKPGLFVASESFYPGWKAELNGTFVDIHRTQEVLRGVFLPAGDGVLKFSFEPSIYRLGLKISIVAFLVLLAGLGLTLWPLRKGSYRRSV